MSEASRSIEIFPLFPDYACVSLCLLWTIHTLIISCSFSELSYCECCAKQERLPKQAFKALSLLYSSPPARLHG